MTWTPPPAEFEFTFESPTPKAMNLNPKKTVLCIVDMENTFCTPGFQLYTERAGEAIEGASKLLEKARAAGATIIFIQSIRKPDSIEFTLYNHPPRLLEGTPDPEIVPALTPKPGEYVVQKFTHDPWARTKLDSLLVDLNIIPGEWTVLLAGVGTSGCAYCGALGFANRLFMTVIPMDATASGKPEDEMMVYHEYMGQGYNYNMDFTTSELVTFVEAQVPIEAAALVS